LGKIGDERALRKVEREDNDKNIRMLAIKALKRLNHSGLKVQRFKSAD
jgi:hypothetical protein